MPKSKETEKDKEIFKLKKEIEKLKKNIKRQKYGLVWVDVPEAFEDDVENKLPILKEVPNKAIKSNDDKPTNILIEGDNYHSLTCLNYTHKNKIDVIYIDPPYNTGSDGFRYKDKRILSKYPDGTEVPKDSLYRHSYWLSFMSKRLELSRTLLKDNGVMFISINEEELFNLKLLCDEIFKPENYLTCFTIKVRHEDRILKGDKDFHEVTEFLLLYRKSDKYETVKRIQDNTSLSEYIYQVKELNKKPKKIKLGNKEVEIFKPDEYKIVKIKSHKDNLKKINIRGSIKEGNSSGRFYMANIDSLKNNFGFLYKVSSIGNDKYPYRYFQAPIDSKKKNGHYFQGVPVNREDTKKVPFPNYFDYEKEFNGVGHEGGINFRNGKKPVSFIKDFIKIGSESKTSIVCDFFAGSGTTGHAVMELNEEDKGKRQFILCTNDENKIMSDVCYPRIKKVIKGHDKQKGLGNSIKYYKTGFVGKNNILNADDKDKAELACNAGELLALSENTLDLVTKNKNYQVFENKKQYTAVYFTESMDNFQKFIKEVLKLQGKKKVAVYIFSWEDNEEVPEFDGLDTVQIKTIPKPILEIYKQIYNLL